MELWSIETIKAHNSGALELWDFGALEPWILGVL